jgi:hypothetical protein
MRPVVTWLLALALLGALPAPGAAAQDPDADSPSGHIYEIPLDDGRGDAAPRRSGDDRGSDTRSSIRSENNFGSSSTVPGAVEAGGGAEPSGSGDTGGGSDGDGSGSGGGASGSEEDIAEGSVEQPERSAAGGESAPATAAAPPSLPRALLLVGLGVVVAAGLGLAARRR